MPRPMRSKPHLRAEPVAQNSAAQPHMVRMAGSGYNHILKGKRSGGQRRCNRIKPMACPINCTSKRVASIAAMTVESLKSKLDTKATAPRNKSETYGNFFCGWTREKMEKKLPSNAAA